MSPNVKRIQEMEACLEECTAAIAALGDQLDRMDALREKMISLFNYYGSEAWHVDRDGDLPDGVRAGVLSEDLVYDAITDVRDASFHMLELATDILKNRI